MADTTEEKPLTQSGICKEVWELYETDQAEFKKRVSEHFTLGYPGWTVVKTTYSKRIVWLRDDRRKDG